MKELDLVLVRFLDHRWPGASPDERAAFEQLLGLPDPDLAAYLLGHATPPDALAGIVVRLREP